MSEINSSINVKRIKRQILKHVKLVRIALLITALLPLSILLFTSVKLVRQSVIGKGISLAINFILPDNKKIITTDGQVNVLILGTAGAGRGAMDEDITDTIIFASIPVKTGKISLVSVPRDIWIPNLKDKINSAYAYGKRKGGVKTGMILARSTVEEIIGKDISYTIVINFNQFKDIIDAIGGIDIDVKTPFTDNQYPIAGKENDTCGGDVSLSCRYETVSFKSGLQHMDGELALKFVRSRHAEGPEGGDIAREKRQQLVIMAIAKKVLSPQVLANPSVDLKLLQILENNIQLDLNPTEIAILGRLIFNSRKNISAQSIPSNLLYNPPNQYLYHNDFYTHAFVFIPAEKDRKWTDVQNWVNSFLR